MILEEYFLFDIPLIISATLAADIRAEHTSAHFIRLYHGAL